jgi:tetratricopeptide (TPR) repeat protein
VDAQEPTADRKQGDGGRGQVEAYFVMRNQGESEESFDVWFPLGASSIYDAQEITNFSVWVDGVSVPVSNELQNDPINNQPVPWATWPTTFPPGQDVVLRVTYDMTSTEWEPFFTYHYILETGAGWWGPIGEGTITFRLPYEVNSSNTVLELDQPNACVNPGYFVVSGSDVIWSFSELEPTPADNVCLTIVRPALWQGITAARDEAAANPDSPEAHLRLARLQAAALPYMKGIFGAVMYVGDSVDKAELALAAYERVLELDPTNIDIYVEYLELLAMVFEPDYETWLHANRLYSTLEQTLRLAPDNERLRSIAERVQQIESIRNSPPAPSTPVLPTPTPTATFMPSPISLTVMPSTSPQTSAGGKPWPGIIALVLVPLGILGVRRARRK